MAGSGDDPASDLDAAERVGRALAARGAVVVCGGRGGVMEAACRGAKDGGGTTLGILPGLDRADANPYVDVAVPTGLGEARNALVVRAADALIVLALGLEPTRSLVISQVVLSFGIPFALVPLVMLTRRRDVMGELVNRRLTSVVAGAVAGLVIALNVFLLGQTFLG